VTRSPQSAATPSEPPSKVAVSRPLTIRRSELGLIGEGVHAALETPA
jgi:hypothetical protein